ncbi:cytochrome ubiquinol oxidase subunit I [Nocardiopsis sp. NPDC058789]|uniref:Cytochrome ubiquinol oxidase subunit I n=1 Tax=Nocardiopsis eucommiae TaxID=2831970 RepID=A0A975LBJ0_9ACTN|nr:cytochrome ubiquinol oxidase subunit I [Nocardiopsis eucommiae]
MFDDPLVLARLQFALTAATHYVFVALTLGLAPYILGTQLVATLRGDRSRMVAVRFWGGLYLVNYGMGVLSGLVMELQLALNWSGLHETFGYTFAAPLAVETMTAFFVESTFLGLWIFGWDRMGRWAHLFCFSVVTATAYSSAWWVLVSNGFLRHPVGFAMVDGVAHLTDPVALVTNPAAVFAFLHVVSGAMLVGALVVAAASAHHLLRGDDPHGIFRRGMGFAAVTMTVMPMVVVSFGGAQFRIFGQDPPTSGLTYTAERIEAIEAAGPSAFVSAVNTAGELVMMTAWTVMFLLGPVMLLARYGGPLNPRRWFGNGRGSTATGADGPGSAPRVPSWFRPRRWGLALLLFSPFLPYLASVGGWVYRETNRQPWVVVHHLTTADAVTPLSPGAAVTSFTLFTVAFGVLACVTCWLLVRFARRGPEGGPLAEHWEEERSKDPDPVPTF